MKKTRTFAGLALAAGLVAGTVGISPASADPAETIATFTVEGGALEVSAPTSADLGSTFAGAEDISGELGFVSVFDLRGALVADWTSSVSVTDFTTGGGTPAETVAAADVEYTSGPALTTEGNGTFQPGGTTTPGGESAVAFSHVGGSGVNAASWIPSLTVALSQANVAGEYTGTVVHSVA